MFMPYKARQAQLMREATPPLSNPRCLYQHADDFNTQCDFRVDKPGECYCQFHRGAVKIEEIRAKAAAYDRLREALSPFRGPLYYVIDLPELMRLRVRNKEKRV